MEGVEIEEIVECAEERGELGSFGVELVAEKMVIEKSVDAKRSENEGNESG